MTCKSAPSKSTPKRDKSTPKRVRAAKLAALDKALTVTAAKRDAALRTFRLRCKHLRLIEEPGSPPHRICMDCAAIECGWHCGYQVLTLRSEVTDNPPDRAIHANARRSTLAVWKNDWPYYPVGQLHPNFSKKWDYKSLTAIEEDIEEDDDA